MLKTRIIPKLLLRDGRNVKGTRFESLRDVGHPVTNARIYDAQGADELIFLDIAAGSQSRTTLFETIAKVSQEIFMPFCVGGGVKSVEHIRELLLVGADKVSVNTASVESPELVAEAAKIFGSQCVVASIDYRQVGERFEVFTHGGTVATGLDPREHAMRMEALGAGEILLTAIDRDGTMQGYDLPMLRAVTSSVSIPVIASGGAGSLRHLADAVVQAQASAVAVGSLFHFTDQSPIKANTYLRGAGIPVRA